MVIIRKSDELRLRARSLNRGLFNPPTLGHWRFDGIVATMHQSGTHWLKFMLAHVLAKTYDLPPPAHIGDRVLIGRRKDPPVYPQIPRLVITHTIPHYLFRSRALLKIFNYPPYVILVRDIRDALVGHYEKWKSKYNVNFSTFLRGDVRGKKYYDDIWLRIRFLNGWGAVVKRNPEQAMVLRYEDLIADTPGQLARVCDHFNIEGITPELLKESVAASSKSEMSGLEKPDMEMTVVRFDTRPPDDWYCADDRRFFAELCRRNLKYTFGYRYW